MARPMPRSGEEPGPRRKSSLRAVNADDDEFQLVNQDPGRWYTFVDPHSKTQPVRFWRSLGYKVEARTKTGVRLKNDVAPDDDMPVERSPYFKAADTEHIEHNGMVLMSCTLERHIEIVRKGAGGGTGMDMYDRIDREMLRKNKIPNEGDLSTDIATFKNETKPREALVLTGG